MQLKCVAVVLILFNVFQLLILLAMWLHSRHINFNFLDMIGDRLTGRTENRFSNENEKTNPADAQKQALPACPDYPPHLWGLLSVEFDQNLTLESVRTQHNSTGLEGGRFKPPDCVSSHKVAIIIPFRNRHHHLIQWLNFLHPVLQRQQLDYGVYVINQDGNGTFNKGRLMNTGFFWALKDYNYTCFVFADVDLIPTDDRNFYRCADMPRHLAVSIDKFDFVLQTVTAFGGVVSMTIEQYLTANGYSNEYWGWGGEDDDMYNRHAAKSRTISRPDGVTARYKMIKHERDLLNEENPKNLLILSKTSSVMEEDGLSSLAVMIRKVERDMLYTFITVDVGIQIEAGNIKYILGELFQW